jgi:hypothetical protein
MIGTRQIKRVISAANKAHAKVVPVGDAEQLQAIEAGAAFRGLAATHGVSNLTEVRRQKTDWQRTATQDLSTGNTTAALGSYQPTISAGGPAARRRSRYKPDSTKRYPARDRKNWRAIIWSARQLPTRRSSQTS